MGEVKGQGHIVHPVSNRCTSFSFYISRTNHSWDMYNKVFDTSEIFEGNLAKKRVSNIPPQPDDDHDQSDIATKFCSDLLSGSHFIL